MDFVKIKERRNKIEGRLDIYPDFVVCRSKDLMVRGKSFYAIWDEAAGLWSTDEYDVQRLVDEELWAYYERRTKDANLDYPIHVKSMSDFSSGSWAQFRKYMSNISDSSHTLDSNLTFSNTKVKKTDYVSKRLPYALEAGDWSAFDELIGRLYEPDQREKLEWAIGAIISGDSKKIEKFLVLYGQGGTGKSTVLKIIQWLFTGYYTMFEAKALASSSNEFSTEVFKNNPLVAIQHDGDLSRIEDNTKLNSIISHEEMIMNEKYKPKYTDKANCFLFIGTNNPVKITDSKSGIIRRLIDVKPSGKKFPRKKYDELMAKIETELGAIAYHCLEVYNSLGKGYYDTYEATEMMLETNVFYNFIEYNLETFKEYDGVSLTRAYDMYNKFCESSMVDFKLPRHKFREELKNYFSRFDDITRIDGKQVRSYYSGFISEKFDGFKKNPEPRKPDILELNCTESLFDKIAADWPAQYAGEDGKPAKRWSEVRTKLRDLDTTKLHYVFVPDEYKNHIFIDFDLRDENGNKNAKMNLEEASKWPKTYAEYSQGGEGLHLHYIYGGPDPNALSRVYDKNIEVKVCVGNSSIRRRLSRCNDLPIATIKDGLPLKGVKMINTEAVKTEKALRKRIEDCIRKVHHGATKPEMDFIFKSLEDAYNSGLKYDVTNMRQKVLTFAMGSTNQADYCVNLIRKMHFRSEDLDENKPDSNEKPIIFLDVEVFPNLFLVNWKYPGEGKKIVRMINPTPEDIELLITSYRIIGFNCRRYDNHILYGRYMGYSNEELYKLSQRIIGGDRNAFFGEAYNLSYTDIYDFCSKKQSLKKWEIELGIHHQELGLRWDEPVPEELWEKVAEYCDNDVIATEAVFNARKDDFIAREILADIAEGTVNDTTNQLSAKFILGSDKHPQAEFNYRNMGDESQIDGTVDVFTDDMYTVFDSKHRPIFPGYIYDGVKSTYRDEVVGEGGYVYAEPGIHHNVALLDIASMHPSTIIAEELFGPRFTARFKEIVDARIAIKHKDFDKARKLLGGKLAKYLDDASNAKKLAGALKIVINSVYGLTSAKFENAFRDPRNVDNIVAKRGALFMINLKHEVQKRGFTVAHIKTDSIKIPNATPEIIEFVSTYGKLYGYNFEHEATYDRMCLVNDAVYIAKYDTKEACMEKYGYIPGDINDHPGEWTATGAQFQQPYVFKTLFSKEPIIFDDLCETKTVTSAMYLDLNENLPEGEHDYKFVGKAGLFSPIKPGRNGGILLREKDGKYYAVGGSKGYRWMESEMVKLLGYEDEIDISYYRSLVDDAVETISKYGSVDEFVNGHSSFPIDSKLPSWIRPCGDPEKKSCEECVNYDPITEKCRLGFIIY